MLRARVWGPPELRKVLVPGSALQARKDTRGPAGRAASVHVVGCGSRCSEALSAPSQPKQGLPTSADLPLILAPPQPPRRTCPTSTPEPRHPGVWRVFTLAAHAAWAVALGLEEP